MTTKDKVGSYFKFTIPRVGEGRTFPTILSFALDELQEGNLKRLLTQHKSAIGWTIANLKGINPSIYIHKIFLEDDAKLVHQMQRRLNPII